MSSKDDLPGLDDLINLITRSKQQPNAISTSKQPLMSITCPTSSSVSATAKTQRASIKITIRTLFGNKMKYDMDPADTVKMIKNKIYSEHKIWPQHQRLIYDGNILTDEQTLNILGIRNNATLYMVLTTICSNTYPPIIISIQKLNGDIFKMSCTLNDTVQTLKQNTQNQEGYDAETQILVFKYDRLENFKMLREYNIRSHSVLRIMLKPTRSGNIQNDEEGNKIHPMKIPLQSAPNKAISNNDITNADIHKQHSTDYKKRNGEREYISIPTEERDIQLIKIEVMQNGHKSNNNNNNKSDRTDHIPKLSANAASFKPKKSINKLDRIEESMKENKPNSEKVISLDPHRLYRAKGNIYISRRLTEQIIPIKVKEFGYSLAKKEQIVYGDIRQTVNINQYVLPGPQNQSAYIQKIPLCKVFVLLLNEFCNKILKFVKDFIMKFI